MNKNTYIIDNTAEWRIKQILRENAISEHEFISLAQYATKETKKRKQTASKSSLSYYVKGSVDYLAYISLLSVHTVQIWLRKRLMAQKEQPPSQV